MLKRRSVAAILIFLILVSACDNDDNSGKTEVTDETDSPADENTPVEGTRAQSVLKGSDRQANDAFGFSVSIKGRFAIVGAPKEDGGEGSTMTDAGAAYIFEESDSAWTQTAVLHASDKSVGDGFGYAVSIGDDYAIVGAYQEDGGAGDPALNAGAAYIYEKVSGQWTETAVLHASDAETSDHFGFAVAIDGTIALVGAYWEDGGDGDPEGSAGATYVFERNDSGNWVETAILHASNMLENDDPDYFGYSLDISSTYAVIGGFGNSYNDGSAYIFEREGLGNWTEAAILQPEDMRTNSKGGFLQSVAISGNYAVVGVCAENGGTGTAMTNAGAAYIYKRDAGGTWLGTAILYPSDAAEGDFFGRSVAIDGETVVVGAFGEGGGSDYLIELAGAVYQFDRESGETWTETGIIHSPLIQTMDLFGLSVGISGDTIITGAFQDDGEDENPILNTGTAYIY